MVNRSREVVVGALNISFESNQYEEILNTIKRQLQKNDNENSKLVEEYIKHYIIKREDFDLEIENCKKENQKKQEGKI